MKSKLHCPSCGRFDGNSQNCVKTFDYQGNKWCTSCATIKHTSEGSFISPPSPGLMIEGKENDPLAAWWDCYLMQPKKRILIKKAKEEIQRAWKLWDGDKADDNSMFFFFGWLSRFRPYFLTFRSKGDPWQTVHCWLIQFERNTRNNLTEPKE